MSAATHRRGSHVDDEVLTATLQLVDSRGYEFTIEDVAAKANVHKTTIYRRWVSKPALIAAAVARLAQQRISDVDSGDPLADLERLALQVAESLNSPAGRNPLRAVISAAGSDPLVPDVAREFFRNRYSTAVRVISRAQERGLIDPGIDATLMWQSIVNPMHIDAICGTDTSPLRAAALVSLALRGAMAPTGGNS